MNKIKFRRLEVGLSQVELALAAGVPRYSISLAELAIRQPSPDEQAKISEALGVKREELFPCRSQK